MGHHIFLRQVKADHRILNPDCSRTVLGNVCCPYLYQIISFFSLFPYFRFNTLFLFFVFCNTFLTISSLPSYRFLRLFPDTSVSLLPQFTLPFILLYLQPSSGICFNVSLHSTLHLLFRTFFLYNLTLILSSVNWYRLSVPSSPSQYVFLFL